MLSDILSKIIFVWNSIDFARFSSICNSFQDWLEHGTLRSTTLIYTKIQVLLHKVERSSPLKETFS
jgi:hypothetical protein